MRKCLDKKQMRSEKSLFGLQFQITVPHYEEVKAGIWFKLSNKNSKAPATLSHHKTMERRDRILV